MKQKLEVLELNNSKLSRRLFELENSTIQQINDLGQDLKRVESKVGRIDHKRVKKTLNKLAERLDGINVHEDKIKQIDVKMVDICETMEGMVSIIKDNGAQVKAQLEDRIESVIQDMEIFETQINRSNGEMSNHIASLQSHNEKIVDALKNFHAQQVQKFNTLSEWDEEDETEEIDDSESDIDQNQENMIPNIQGSPNFQSKALVNLLKSQGIKLQVPKMNNGRPKLSTSNKN